MCLLEGFRFNASKRHIYWLPAENAHFRGSMACSILSTLPTSLHLHLKAN